MNYVRNMRHDIMDKVQETVDVVEKKMKQIVNI